MKYSELHIGQQASLSRKFTHEEVLMFSELSLDTNPLHINKEYADKSIFGQRIVHGHLAASLISGVIGTILPGEGAIYLNQNMNFRRPVFYDELITATCTVTNIRQDKPIITLETICRNEKGDIVIDGTALIKIQTMAINEIHPSVIMEGDIKLGEGNKILPNCIIYGPVEIGDDNIIGPNVVIGTPGQDTRNRYYDCSDKKIKIGNRNIIREFTAIQKPCYEGVTYIGDDVFLMQSVHIPHDAHLYDKVVITPMTVLAGIAKILEGANLALGCKVNQRAVVGQYSIAAAGSVVMKNIKPFSRYIPNKPISVNQYAIDKYGFGEYQEEITEYVLNDKRPKSQKILEIIETFEKWVDKYGQKTYSTQLIGGGVVNL